MNTRRWRGMVSFEGGLGAFCKALAAPLGGNLHLSTEAKRIERISWGYRIHALKGPEEILFEAPRLVIGVDLPGAIALLQPLAPNISAELRPIESVSLAVVNLGFSIEAFPSPPEGFGFLVPATEKGVHLLGTLWASNVFPSQAPEGRTIARVFVGGVRSPDWIELSDDELLKNALAELRQFVEIQKEPETVHISRYRVAVPQMFPGHTDRIEKVEKILVSHPGLYLVGNYMHGVSVNDCVVHSRKVAKVLSATRTP